MATSPSSLSRRIFGESGPIMTFLFFGGCYWLFHNGDQLYQDLLHSPSIGRGSPELLHFLLMGVYPFLLFVTYGTLLALVDFLPMFQAFRNDNKMQPKYQPSLADYVQTAKVSGFNFLVLGLGWSALLAWVVIPWWGQGDDSWQKMPSVRTFAWQMAVTLFFQELLFYSSHRLLHHPRIYKYIHKLHHQWTAPFAIAATYAHPVEHIVSNMLPLSFGPLITRMNPLLTLLWTTVGLLNTMSVHSGYQLPFMPCSDSHDLHHKLFDCQYGTLGVLDWLFETQGPIDALVAAKRAANSVAWVPLPKTSASATTAVGAVAEAKKAA